MKCERCETEAEPGERLCGWCECDERNAARRLGESPARNEARNRLSRLNRWCLGRWFFPAMVVVVFALLVLLACLLVKQ